MVSILRKGNGTITSMARTNHPKLLFILSDEHHRDLMGFRGDPVHTPSLDALASSGTYFNCAYTPCPICVPARASLATGRYVNRIGYWDNSFGYDGQIESWHHQLRSAGIRVDSIGKLHFRAVGEDHGFSEEHIPLHIVDGRGDVLSCIRHDAPVRHKRPGIENAGAGDSSYMRYDSEIGSRAAEWIRLHADDDAPWALFVGFVQPHPPYMARRELVDHYLSMGFPMPPQWDEWPNHPHLENLRKSFDFATPFSRETVRRLAAAYRGACTQLDEEIAKVLEALDSSGLTDSTLVVYTSDHGESLGARGIFGKFTMYDESAGIPLILSGAGVPADRVVHTPASLVDLYPTIVEHFGLTPPADLPGIDLCAQARDAGRRREAAENRAQLRGHDETGNRIAFSEYHAVGSEAASYMVTDGVWKYIHYVGAPSMLFDLTNDPLEVENRIDDAGCAEVRDRLHRALLGIVDPQAVDAAAKRAQAAQIERFGGRSAIIARGAFDNSPVPGEEPEFH